jgi:choline dehydrogenase-like flavoprotein
LAEAWTAGAYAFNDDDLREFPFGYQEIAPFYAKVAERIGVAGARDDLSTHHPLHEQLSEPIDLDDSGMRLMASYEARRDRLVRRHGIRMGRSRQAALAKALGDRQGCRLCGRCLWGCPNGALYTPSLTLQGLYGSDNFTYLPGHFASHFTCSDSATIDALVTYPEDGGGKMLHYADVFVLACGTIGSSNLFLRTLFERTGDIVRLPGLMDNRQILAPFFNLAMLGRRSDPDSYQYHQLTLGLENEDPSRFVHGQITTFTTGDTHPLISQLPLDLKSSTSIVGALRSGLCVVNLNFADDRREGNALTLDADRRDEFGWPTLVARYAPAPGESASLTETLKRVRRFLWNLRAPLIPGMARVRPMGASAHYSGTLPMSAQRRELTVSANGQSHDFDNLFVVDGSIFPFLPAKNLTFTLMANATRIAANAF